MFSNGTVQAQTSTKEVSGDLVLELLHPVDGHHRNPHAVAPRELQVAVDVHHLEGEPGPLALGRQHRRGRRRLGRVRRGVRRTLRDGAAPASPPAHGWRSRGGPGAGRGLGSGAEARRKPAYITVAPRASPVASWSLALAKAKTPPAAASSTPAAISRLPSKRGRSSRRPRRASPLATAPPTTTRVPTTLPPTAKARMPTSRRSLPSNTTHPASPATLTSTSATATALARLNSTSPTR